MEFAKTQSGKGKSEQFTREILKHVPQDADLEEFRRLYDSAFSDTAKRYQRFATIENTVIMDTIPGNDILSVAIVNSADTELAGFLREIGATEWMRQGHDEYAHSADGKCPYCGRKLPDDFEQTFVASFDTRYQANLQKLSEFLKLYRDTANALFMPLQRIPSEVYPQIDVKPYTDKLEVLRAAIQANIETIKSKIDNPAAMVSLHDIAPILEELATIINGFNVLIDANNAIVDAGPKKRTECTEQAFSLLAFRLKDVIAAYQQSDAQITAELATLDAEIEAHNITLEGIKAALKSLRGQTVETETAKESINAILRDSGM